jgi:hypothetical protein
MSFIFKNDMTDKLKQFKTKFETDDLKIKKKCAVQLLTWANTGSPNEKTVPPIKEGFLRGSGSVFVGSEFVLSDSKYNNNFINKSNNDNNKNVITIGYNVPYAAKMHEHLGEWGEQSKKAGNVGNKFLEKHIKNDCKDVVKLYAELMKGTMK